ncbi:helix-turn-helix domain-containing protein [Streptomyces sp. NPDC058469]|uniref:helix-turn-helix domain-containing protein n=1 Tax=Streptomyces sp. NPDC058469 TaxID=3346514 RepID=UPI00365B3AF5
MDRHHGLAVGGGLGQFGQLGESLPRCLDAFGDVSEASKALNNHSNTLRSLVRKAAVLTGLDLDDLEHQMVAEPDRGPVHGPALLHHRRHRPRQSPGTGRHLSAVTSSGGAAMPTDGTHVPSSTWRTLPDTALAARFRRRGPTVPRTVRVRRHQGPGSGTSRRCWRSRVGGRSSR